MIFLASVLLVLAALPTVMTLVNVIALGVPPAAANGTRVAILIPARDEADGIADCLSCALASTAVDLEVIVLDDHSSDATAMIVSRAAAADPRLRLATAPVLPPGWSGKAHACHVLASLTEAPNLLFIDADVHLAQEAAARLAGALKHVDLVSGVPRQRMQSFGELLLIPMINMLLLGYLPIPLSRRDPRPALGVACGQMIATRADSYARAGGHARIRKTLHDGLKLPRLFRAMGFTTAIIAGSSLASCRMYFGWFATLRGTMKNATEGMAQPIALPIWSLLLLGGHVLPWIVLIAALSRGSTVAAVIVAMACAGPLAARLSQSICCREPIVAILLNPFGVVLLLVLQWWALFRKWAGRPEDWRGRSYPARG